MKKRGPKVIRTKEEVRVGKVTARLSENTDNPPPFEMFLIPFSQLIAASQNKTPQNSRKSKKSVSQHKGSIKGAPAMHIAYWINPEGQLAPVPQRHILSVLEHPEKFGYTREFLHSLYQKHDEKIGTEQHARAEIIADLVARGWIRVRRYRDHWAVNVPKLTPRPRKLLTDLCRRLIGRGVLGYKESERDMPMRIDAAEGKGTPEDFSLEKIARGKLLSKRKLRTALAVLKSVEYFKNRKIRVAPST